MRGKVRNTIIVALIAATAFGTKSSGAVCRVTRDLVPAEIPAFASAVVPQNAQSGGYRETKWDYEKSQTTAPETPRAKVTFSFGKTSVTYSDVFVKAPDHTLADEFDERRINAPLSEKLEYVYKNLSNGHDIKSALLYTFPALKAKVDEFIKKVNTEPTDAEISFRPYDKPMFLITRERVGYAVNETKLYYDIYAALKDGETSFTAPVDEIEADVTAEDLSACTRLRSTFSTDYSSSGDNRKHNIRLALSKINGKRVNAGEEFSFNRTVGKRTAANGFAEAKIIVDGDYTDGVGGGVCQASTTVYNAALLAGMSVIEARPHSLPPSYVAPSFDAMVNSGSSDMRFVNKTDRPVFIRTYCTESKAVVEIYGLKNEYEIVRKSEVVSRGEVPADRTVIDAENKYDTAGLESGGIKRVSYGSAAVGSEGYLYFYKAGKLVEKRLIRRDAYRSRAGIIAVKP